MRVLFLVALFTLNYAEEDNVVVLTDDNFDDFVKDNSKVLVEFYAPWCGHCKQLEPEYKKAANKLKADGATTVIAKVDATAETRLAKDYEVRGFPTIKYFNNGEASEYGGGRTEDAIIGWIKKRELPAVSVLADKDAHDKLTKSDTLIVVSYNAKDSDADKVIAKLGDSKRDTYVFGAVHDEALTKELDQKVGTVVLFTQAGEDADKRKFDSAFVASEDLTEKGILDFLNNERFPLIDEIGPENYRDYMDRGLPLVWIAVDPADAEGKDAIIGGLKSYAKDHKGKLSFTYVDGVQYAGHISNLGIKKTPGMVIVNNDTNEKFLFPGDLKSADDVKDFFDKYGKGEIEAFLKSQDPPEKNDDGVRVIVGSTFKAEALSADADVLVEFYAPWCGHCKKLAPEYEKVGEEFKGRADVVIAKVDATENDTPEDVSGFPTLVFYPRGADSFKNKSKYEGARTADAMIKFMHGKVPEAAAEGGEEAGGEEEKEEL